MSKRRRHWSRRALAPQTQDMAGHEATGPATVGLQVIIRAAFLLISTGLLLTSCMTPDTRHQIVVSVPEQKLVVMEDGRPIGTYPVSTSKFALSDSPGSRGTPLGELEIAKKIGDGAPVGAVFKDRRMTGEILVPDAPGRDPIVTRILWLRGREAQNANAYGRYIYIHGTAEERNIGRPASYGCIRMRSRDVLQVYNAVGYGARVRIINAPLSAAISPAPATPVAANGRGGMDGTAEGSLAR